MPGCSSAAAETGFKSEARSSDPCSLQQFLVKRLLAGFEMKADTQGPQRLSTKIRQTQLDQVLLRRNDKAIRCLFACPASQLFDVRSGYKRDDPGRFETR